MNTLSRLLPVICAAMIADAFAADPPTPPATVKKVLVDDTLNDAQLKQILARGYRPKSQVRGNEVLYCRSEHELGSHFEKKVCKTATQILQDEVQGKEATTLLERDNGNRAAK